MCIRDRAWIERRDRLVGDDELRPLHERACNRRTLLLAAGQLRAALERMIRDADARKRTHRTLLLGMREVPEHRAQRRQPAEQAEADIRQHRQPRNQIELLKDDADPHPQAVGGPAYAAALLHRLAKQQDRAFVAALALIRIDRRESCNRAHEGRFAGTRRPDEPDHFTAGDGHADVVEHADAAKRF